MTAIDLDREEQDILDAFDAGELRSDMSPARKTFLEQSAAATIEREEDIRIRISERDLSVLRRMAFEAGMPFQTLAASILHKYASGSLHDATANKPTPANAYASRG